MSLTAQQIRNIATRLWACDCKEYRSPEQMADFILAQSCFEELAGLREHEVPVTTNPVPAHTEKDTAR